MEKELHKVVFHDKAAEDWRKAFPDLPPGPELVLYMESPQTCENCGKTTDDEDDGLWGMDPEYVTEDGLIVGDSYCAECMEEGH